MSLLNKLVNVGVEPYDEEILVHQKQFVVYEALLMSMGGLVWGILWMIFDRPFQSSIPFLYVVFSTLNILYFKVSKRFEIVRDIQTGLSLLLPFVFQWVLGGFAASGGVMLWSLLSLAASLSYMNIKNSLFWLFMYTALTVISGIFDGYFADTFPSDISARESVLLLTLNLSVVSVLIFLLIIFYVMRHANSYNRLQDTHTKLIQSEKMAALGQLSAGIAHEVNTPLGAIKSCAEESQMASVELLQLLTGFIDKFSPEEKDHFVRFMLNFKPADDVLSTREERALKKDLTLELESRDIANARYLAEKMVQVGIHNIPGELERYIEKDFHTCILILYNLFNQERNNKTIQIAVDRASRVIRALKMYLHTSGSENPEPFSLKESVETVLTIYHNQLKQGVEVRVDLEDMPPVLGYVEEINQIWTNLIINACQAMKFSGTLSISSTKDAAYAKVSITDTGGGIPDEIQDKIFNPSFTTKSSGEGSGLGLDIVKKIVNRHKGKIEFLSTNGVGTTFTVYLPLTQGE